MRPCQVLLSIGIGPHIRAAREWVTLLHYKRVPPNLFAVRYDRASGPGGQNVNKVNTKCTIMLNNFSLCSWLPQEVRRQVVEKNSRYYAPSGDSLVIQASESRSREVNRRLCVQKFVDHIRELCIFPAETDKHTVEKWDGIKRKADERRIQEKKLQSSKKRLRNKKDLW